MTARCISWYAMIEQLVCDAAIDGDSTDAGVTVGNNVKVALAKFVAYAVDESLSSRLIGFD